MSREILDARDEALKPLRRVINRHGGEDLMEPYCTDLYEDVMDLQTKKKPFKLEPFKSVKGTECWKSVKALRKKYNQSWRDIREQRAQLFVELVDIAG